MQIRKLNLFFAVLLTLTIWGHFIKNTNTELTVPAFATIDEYTSWASSNNVSIIYLNEDEEVVNPEDFDSILEVVSSSVSKDDPLIIKVWNFDPYRVTIPIFEK